MNTYKGWRFQKRSLFFCLPLFMILAIVSGCQDGDIQRRLDSTIQDLQEHSRDKDQDIVDVLQKSTPRTLEAPAIVHVRITTESPRAVPLVVRWVEKYPTPNALLLRNHKTGYQKIFTFPQEYIAQNNDDAKRFVLFYCFWRLEYHSEEWKDLEPQLQDGELEAVLLCDEKPVSNTCRVERRSPK